MTKEQRDLLKNWKSKGRILADTRPDTFGATAVLIFHFSQVEELLAAQKAEFVQKLKIASFDLSKITAIGVWRLIREYSPKKS